MKKLITITLIAATAFNTAAWADASDVSKDADNVKADTGAIQKDNAAIAKDKDAMKKNRADKAAAKANGQYGKQAVDSVAIGGDQTAIGEKKAEKNVDTKILTHHQNQLNDDANAAKGTTSNQ